MATTMCKICSNWLLFHLFSITVGLFAAILLISNASQLDAPSSLRTHLTLFTWIRRRRGRWGGGGGKKTDVLIRVIFRLHKSKGQDQYRMEMMLISRETRASDVGANVEKKWEEVSFICGNSERKVDFYCLSAASSSLSRRILFCFDFSSSLIAAGQGDFAVCYSKGG